MRTRRVAMEGSIAGRGRKVSDRTLPSASTRLIVEVLGKRASIANNNTCERKTKSRFRLQICLLTSVEYTEYTRSVVGGQVTCNDCRSDIFIERMDTEGKTMHT